MILPNNLTRYTGANAFTTEDAAGNVFAVFQGPLDSGVCVMRRPDGTMTQIALPPIVGRPSLEVNPLCGLWVVGNREAGPREFPPRYRIAEYVPFVLGPPGSGGPVAAEDAAPIAPLGAEAWPNYGQSYPDERVIQDGRWYVRANKIIALLVQLARAVAQLQRLARQRGELR